NELLDQRDQLVKELNELVSVKVYEQDGRVNLAIGNGQVVLSGDTVYPLKAMRSNSDPERIVVGITVSDGKGALVGVEMDEKYIRGGQLGGLVQYRQEVLDDVQNNLGRMALGLADAFNKVHEGGMDLHGEGGMEFFSVADAKVTPSSGSENLVSVKITDVNALTGDDYRIEPKFDADGDFEKYEIFNVTTGAGPYDADSPFEGLTFTFTTQDPKAGDSWLIQPTRNAAASLQVEITDPSKIAAAAPGTGE